jgi:hypothetical protein
VSEHGCERRLSYAAFSAEDEYLVFDPRETGGYEREVGVRALGRGGAYRLVWTAGAGVAFAGELRFGSGTMF